jgi:hypothetical protein
MMMLVGGVMIKVMMMRMMMMVVMVLGAYVTRVDGRATMRSCKSFIRRSRRGPDQQARRTGDSIPPAPSLLSKQPQSPVGAHNSLRSLPKGLWAGEGRRSLPGYRPVVCR